MRKLFTMMLLASSPIFAADSNYQPTQTNQSDLDAFYGQLQVEIQKQNDLVQKLAASVERKDVVSTDANVIRFENANAMLGVKKTLYANFYNTPSVNSPLVRQKLLSIFKKELITTGDLAELQAIVDQERPKYIQQPQPQPAQAK